MCCFQLDAHNATCQIVCGLIPKKDLTVSQVILNGLNILILLIFVVQMIVIVVIYCQNQLKNQVTQHVV